MGGTLGNRASAVNQYHKSEKKNKRGIKALKKHNNMIFCMSKCSGSRHELKNIKNIRAKASKKHDYSISDSFTDDSDSSLYSDRE